MNKLFWQEVASLWVSIQSKEDIKMINNTVQSVFNDSIRSRQDEKPFLDELFSKMDEEFDDDGY